MSARNPWIPLLWVVGALLMAVSLSGELWTTSLYMTRPVPDATNPVIGVIQQLANSLAYPGLIVGLGTIAGLLFLHARNRSRPNRSGH